MKTHRWRLSKTLPALLCLPVCAQPAVSLESLAAEMREMRSAIQDLRTQLDDSRREARDLRRELEGLRGAPIPEAAKEDQQLINAKLAEQSQTKVESGSKYRVRLSGMALLNVVSTSGQADNMDVPFIAQRGGGGSFGATARQSLIGLEVFGPTVGGAKTRGDMQFDFFGGFPSTPEGVTAGLMRLRTATLHLDWERTSVVAGQESPFFSPLSPTSLASVGYPALSYAGNLWTWTPQVYLEHRFGSGLTMQSGILDTLTGEEPESEYNRIPTAGERSRIPAFASSLGWEHAGAALGAGGWYSRQHWSLGQNVDAWAATADWSVPIGSLFSFSGELYRGRSMGGFGGGPNESAILDSAGGWAQLKYKPLEKVEFNAAFGEDHGFRAAVVPVRRNAAGFLNVIWQARSNLLFSVEYRRLRTTRTAEPVANTGHVNIAAGVTF